MAHILLDLDGTLTDTNAVHFEDVKCGRDRSFSLSDIPLIPGALQFVRSIKQMGHDVSIVSDSHGAYVERVAKQCFDVSCLALADKPNTARLRSFLRERFGFPDAASPEDFVMVGDTRLDVHLARALSIPSVSLEHDAEDPGEPRAFYRSRVARIKDGATYYCRSYGEVLRVLQSPAPHRLVLEDPAGRQSMRLLNERNKNGGYTMYRALGRQNQGLCDRYGGLVRYYEFQSVTRSSAFLAQISDDVSRYLSDVIRAGARDFSWDYITCVADKASTKPPRKMADLLHSIDIPIPKAEFFSWSLTVEGSIRHYPTTEGRRRFVGEFVFFRPGENLQGKNVIVLDDQYTTGATADSHVERLIEAGAANVLFIALFFIVSDVPSEMQCPRCGKITQIKFRKTDGRMFYSCTPREYNGSGCGWMEWAK